MNLIDVYCSGGVTAHNLELLYDLLAEREPSQSISHKKLPTRMEHLKFVASMPYEAWYLIDVQAGILNPHERKIAGAVYLTKQREIGVSVFKECHGMGYGAQAIQEIMRRHGPGRYLANINPQNDRSMRTFRRLGFKHIQNTYALEQT